MKLKYIGALPKTFPVGELQPGEVFTVPQDQADSYLLRPDIITAEELKKPRRKPAQAATGDAGGDGEQEAAPEGESPAEAPSDAS